MGTEETTEWRMEAEGMRLGRMVEVNIETDVVVIVRVHRAQIADTERRTNIIGNTMIERRTIFRDGEMRSIVAEC